MYTHSYNNQHSKNAYKSTSNRHTIAHSHPYIYGKKNLKKNNKKLFTSISYIFPKPLDSYIATQSNATQWIIIF